jgi:Mrp family chromosome partitioning ATPase
MKFLRAEAGDEDTPASIHPLVQITPPPANRPSNGATNDAAKGATNNGAAKGATHGAPKAAANGAPKAAGNGHNGSAALAAAAPDAVRSEVDGVRPERPQIRPEVLDACVVALRRMGGAQVESVGVTSSSRGEGRSTIAAAMAVIQSSEYMRKTILLELDVREPSAAREFGLSEGPGVAEFLRDGLDIEQCIQWPTPNLGVVVAGAGAPMSQLLRGSGAESIVTALSRRVETIVFDLPPLEKGAGGVQLVGLCEKVALVVRAGEVSTHRIEEAAAVLTTPPFVILNGVKSAAPRWARRLLGMR